MLRPSSRLDWEAEAGHEAEAGEPVKGTLRVCVVMAPEDEPLHPGAPAQMPAGSAVPLTASHPTPLPTPLQLRQHRANLVVLGLPGQLALAPSHVRAWRLRVWRRGPPLAWQKGVSGHGH